MKWKSKWVLLLIGISSTVLALSGRIVNVAPPPPNSHNLYYCPYINKPTGFEDYKTFEPNYEYPFSISTTLSPSSTTLSSTIVMKDKILLIYRNKIYHS